MANKVDTRIRHKHDTEENWLKAVNFIPKKGELIIYDIDISYNYERFKIGDGITLVSALPFAMNLEARIKALEERLTSLLNAEEVEF